MRLLGREVSCVRGGREVFSNLDFEAASGEALAVVGPNGSGKTSLLRLMAGLLAPFGGSIGLEGGEAELTLPEQSHYLGHRDALKTALSVSENLYFWRDFLGGTRFDGADILAKVGLDHAAHSPASFLSAGQRRRRREARCGCLCGSMRQARSRAVPESELARGDAEGDVRGGDDQPAARQMVGHQGHEQGLACRIERIGRLIEQPDRPLHGQ